jgi:hypothetical protein
MASIITSLGKLINQTTTEIIDTELPARTAKVINTFITSVFDVVDDTLSSIQEASKEKPKEAPKEPPANP